MACSSRYLTAVDGLFCLQRNDSFPEQREIYMRLYAYAYSSPARINVIIELERRKGKYGRRGSRSQVSIDEVDWEKWNK